MSGETLGELRSYTVPLLLEARARQFPHRLALSASSVRGVRERLTYAQLVLRMNAVARGFAQLGVASGDRVAVYLTNDLGRECILTALGTMALGAVVVPLNTRASDDELSHALQLVQPRRIVTDLASSERISTLMSADTLIVVDSGNQASLFDAWPEPEREPAATRPDYPEDPDLLACLLFTSGTTARAKAVMHTHRTMIATGLCCGSALELTTADLYQGAFPFFTSSALNLACMSCWVRGAGLVLEGRVDNAERLHLVAREGTTYYHGVPSVLNFMLQEYGRGDYDLTRLRRVAYGGAAMPQDFTHRIASTWPWADQVQTYGLTESGPTGSVLRPDEMMSKADSVGRAMPFCKLQVVDDSGEPLPPGNTGEIAIRGPGVAVGYYRNPEASAKAFSGDRVLTGDIGRLDEDGFLYFGDRKKDVINRGGLKIASVAVENVLYQHPSVQEAAVVAVSHRDLGEDVAACVVLNSELEAAGDELSAYCAVKLADYEVPRRWLFLTELPKNPLGKVLKTELRELLEKTQR